MAATRLHCEASTSRHMFLLFFFLQRSQSLTHSKDGKVGAQPEYMLHIFKAATEKAIWSIHTAYVTGMFIPCAYHQRAEPCIFMLQTNASQPFMPPYLRPISKLAIKRVRKLITR